ncbi:MAG: serine/threonine protein kinase [Alphaproteobacteria bacterium]|nr:serine/threonine protein kinase [Alphaproteobacteria bacterium]
MGRPRRYKVLGVLGQGGFGTVYRAQFMGENHFSKLVALKVLNPDTAGIDEIARRLRDEARVLGLMRHRAIVQVDRLIRLDNKWTVVMEYVHGVDLKRLLTLGRLPPRPALEIIAEAAGALHVAYNSHGEDGRPIRLLHRDIKPPNIHLTPFGEVKVLDFGVARAEFANREAVTQQWAFGSPGYMSPERLDGQDDGPAIDVYALGVVLLELLLGETFGKTSADERRHEARVRKALEKLRQLGTHRDVTALVEAMLAWDPARRPRARDVEERSLILAGMANGPPLRFWAEEPVEGLLTEAEQAAAQYPEQFTILTETGVDEPAADSAPMTTWEPASLDAPRFPSNHGPLEPGETRIERHARERTGDTFSLPIPMSTDRTPRRPRSVLPLVMLFLAMSVVSVGGVIFIAWSLAQADAASVVLPDAPPR